MLIQQLQLESIASLELLSKKGKTAYEELKKEHLNTDLEIKNFIDSHNSLSEGFLSESNKAMFLDLKQDFLSLYNLRDEIIKNNFTLSDSLHFYKHLNIDLLEVVKHTTLYSSNSRTYTQIQTLKQLIKYNEYIHRELALIIILKDKYTNEEKISFQQSIQNQTLELDSIELNTHKTELANRLHLIHIHEKYIDNIREIVLTEKGIKKIDTTKLRNNIFEKVFVLKVNIFIIFILRD